MDLSSPTKTMLITVLEIEGDIAKNVDFWHSTIIIVISYAMFHYVCYSENFNIICTMQHIPLINFLAISLVVFPACSCGVNYALIIALISITSAFFICFILAIHKHQIFSTFTVLLGFAFAIIHMILLIKNWNADGGVTFWYCLLGFSFITTPFLTFILLCIFLLCLYIELVIRIITCKLKKIFNIEYASETKIEKGTLYNYGSLNLGELSCGICLSTFDKSEEVICLACNPTHTFHPDCIEHYAATAGKCPLCEAKISLKQQINT